MKKITLIMLLVVCLILTVSCSNKNNTDTNTSETKDIAETKDSAGTTQEGMPLIFNCIRFTTKVGSDMGLTGNKIKVFSVESLNNLLVPGAEKYDPTVTDALHPTSLKELCKKYDDKFFEDYALYIFEVKAIYPGQLDITRLKGDGKTLEFVYHYDEHTRDHFANKERYGFILELPKSLLNEDTIVTFRDSTDPLSK